MKSILMTLSFTILVLACLPTEPCACPPVMPEFDVSGIVTTPAGEPVAGASVFIYAGRLPCPARARWVDNMPRRTNAQGEYFGSGYMAPPAEEFCLRVVAMKPDSRDSVVVENPMTDTSGNDISSFRVNVTFPE